MIIECLQQGTEFPRLQANALLVTDRGQRAIVDCGERSGRTSILGSLAAREVSSSEVELLVLTHLHFDHCENVDLFERALVVVHWREVEHLERLLRETTIEGVRTLLLDHHETLPPFYLRRILRKFTDHRDDYARLVVDRGRLHLVEDEGAAIGGLRIVQASGHSVGHLAVGVPGAQTVWIVGDAVTSLRDWLAPRSAHPPFCWNARAALRTRDAIHGWGSVVVPGHGAPFDARTGAPVPFRDLG
jgi:N-acyl homoserine lactone hydrolase